MHNKTPPFLILYKRQLVLLVLVFQVLFISAQNNLFTKIDSEISKVTFNNMLVENEVKNVLTYQYLYNGAGVGIGDINNDGLPDLFFSGNMVSDRLFLNKGDLVFEDITVPAGLNKSNGWSTGVSMADVNADGWLDIYVCRSGPHSNKDRQNMLYINNGNLTFTEKAKEFGLNDSAFSTQASFFDMDKDGDLDMFLLNHAVTQVKGYSLQEIRNKRDPFSGNKLFRNDNGTFKDVSAEAGISGSAINFGLGVMIGDINNDNSPDIFVTNDYNEIDFLYLNNGYGTFTEIIKTAFGHTSNFSMGCDMADINNDGFLDLFVADMLPEDNYRQKILQGPTRYDMYQLSVDYGYGHQVMQNTLQINNGNNTFSEIANYSGVAATDWSWAPLFADFDNDGYQDLFITNGYRRDFTDMDFMKYTFAEEEKKAFAEGKKVNTLQLVEKMPSVKISNYIYKGNVSIQFENKTMEWGLDEPSFSNGAAFGDLDLDGDLDIVVNNINNEAFIYRNEINKTQNNHYLQVEIKGIGNNSNAIGTRVTAYWKDETFTRELMPARGYQSSVDPILHFGLGGLDTINLIIIFLDNSRIYLRNILTNKKIIVDQINARQEKVINPKESIFADVTNETLLYTHKEEKYIDFKREPLLPYKLSEEGPPLATGDINGDKIPDLYIGGSKNIKGKIFLGDETGAFIPLKNSFIENDSAYEDVDALFFDSDNDGDNDLYVVSGGNEYPVNSKYYNDRLYINTGYGKMILSNDTINNNYTGKSCVRAFDFDDDGDKDLFVGGKLIPGKFPLSPASMILENSKGKFKDITSEICPELLDAGMVNDAIWTDVNNDSKADLIVVGDWMPIRIFLQKKGKFIEATQQYGLTNSSGWWNCISGADFDADGDMDLIVGNRGTNNQIKASVAKPATLYAYDFDKNGTLDPILNYYYNDSISHPFASRDDLLDQINILKKKYIYYKDYANATMETLFPEVDLDTIPKLKTEIFESVYLENTGEKFIVKILPAEAQWFPINCSVIYDFNADGNLDIVAAGNDYGIRPELGRMDAGFGIFLQGDGKGNFSTVPNTHCGLNIPGETKNMQLVKIAGKKYLIIVKNKTEAQVFLLNE